MSLSNLPPGVTDAMVDDHFGGRYCPCNSGNDAQQCGGYNCDEDVCETCGHAVSDDDYLCDACFEKALKEGE